MVFCKYCKQEKESDKFSLSQLKNNYPKCKQCVSINWQNNKEKNSARAKIYYQKNKERWKTYYKNNKDKINFTRRKYREENKEKIRTTYKLYSIKNKDRKNKYVKEKRNNNILFKLRTNVSANIRQALKKQFSSKNSKSYLKYMSYTVEELKQHLESLFEPWMNWENYGKYHYNDYLNLNDNSKWKWNIDHIIPQSDLPYTSMDDENFKKCWSLENLRPLRADINIKEGVSKIRHETKFKGNL